MLIYFGADHRGFQLKEQLKQEVASLGYEVIDMGNTEHNPNDDYPDFAGAVAREVSDDPQNRRGVVMCGSGVGVDIVANKFAGIRAGFGINPDQVYDARHDDDINVLALAADHITPDTASNMAKVFLDTPFSGDKRHRRRLQKIANL